MTKTPPERNETYSAEETARRRDEAVRRALNTPPRPYKDSKVGAKKKTAATASASLKKR